MFAVCFSLMGVALYAAFYLVTRDSMNPFGLGCFIWSVTAGLSSLALSKYESSWVWETYLAVVLCLVAIVSVGIVVIALSGDSGSKQYECKLPHCNTKRSHLFITLLFAICLFASIWSLSANEFIFAAFSGGADAKNNLVDVPLLVDLLCALMPYCGLLALFDLLFMQPSKCFAVFDCCIIAYMLFYEVFAQVSRGTLLIVALGSLFLVSRKIRIRPRHLAFATLVMLGGFYIMATMRLVEGSIVFEYTEYSPAFNSIYSYVSSNFNNLNLVIESGPKYGVIAQSMPIFQMDIDFSSDLSFMTADVFNARTWLSSFYWDLGLVGTLLYPAACFAFVGVIYRLSIASIAYVPLMAFIQKPICVIFFGNYFALSSYNIMVVLLGLAYAWAINSDWKANAEADTFCLNSQAVG